MQSTDTSNDIILSVDSLKVKRGEREVLKGLSFFVRRGEFFTVLGSSGVGKTTLLDVISGFVSPLYFGNLVWTDNDFLFSLISI